MFSYLLFDGLLNIDTSSAGLTWRTQRTFSSNTHENASAKFKTKDRLGFRYTNRYTNRKQSGSDRLASNYSLTGTGAGVSHHGSLTTFVDQISRVRVRVGVRESTQISSPIQLPPLKPP